MKRRLGEVFVTVEKLRSTGFHRNLTYFQRPFSFVNHALDPHSSEKGKKDMPY